MDSFGKSFSQKHRDARGAKLWGTKRKHCMHTCNSVQECVWLSVGMSYEQITLMMHHWNVLLCFSAIADDENGCCICVFVCLCAVVLGVFF